MSKIIKTQGNRKIVVCKWRKKKLYLRLDRRSGQRMRNINRPFENFNYRKSIAYDEVTILLHCL